MHTLLRRDTEEVMDCMREVQCVEEYSHAAQDIQDTHLRALWIETDHMFRRVAEACADGASLT